MANSYPRDLVDYIGSVSDARWPNRARIAVQFVQNYEGEESSRLHDDPSSESLTSDLVGIPAMVDSRSMEIESLYEYGARHWLAVHSAEPPG